MNPCLEIPQADYEGHMALPSVAQAPFLADVLASTVRSLEPSSVAVLGCAGGNGFEALPPDRIQRLVGVDINPAYVAAARSRHQGRFMNLEPLATISKLTHLMALIPPDHFLEQATSLGFQARVSRTLTLNTGKSFHKSLLQSQP